MERISKAQGKRKRTHPARRTARRPKVWASWNYLRREGDGGRLVLTSWMNRPQALPRNGSGLRRR